MSGNPLPWIVLAAIVVVSLHVKGYLKFPATKPDFQEPSAPGRVPTVASATDIDALVRLGSHALGLAFAKAKRIEAEEGLAHRIALEAGASIEATFTAPFSKPEPAGQDPNQAGVKP